MPDVFAFLSVVFITTFTPGPNNIMSMSNASRYGFKNSIRFNFGIFAGFVIIMLLCAVFSGTMSTIIPGVKPYMQIGGALYILWLAWKIFKSSTVPGENPSGTNTFLAGLLLQFVNPKVILYGVTIISAFVIPYYKTMPEIFGFALFLALIGFISTCCWSLFGASFQKFITRNAKIVNSVMSLLLIYCAVSLFI